MAFEPNSLIKQDYSNFISTGSASVFSKFEFGLVDQNGNEIEDLCMRKGHVFKLLHP